MQTRALVTTLRRTFGLSSPAARRALEPAHAYEPPTLPCPALDELEDTGCFTIEGYATGFNWQPGTLGAKFDVQDFAMNAAMGGSGQTTANFNLPYALISRAFARAGNPLTPRVRIVVEVY